MGGYIKGDNLEISNGVVTVHKNGHAISGGATGSIIGALALGPAGFLLGGALGTAMGAGDGYTEAIPLDKVSSIDMKSKTVYLK